MYSFFWLCTPLAEKRVLLRLYLNQVVNTAAHQGVAQLWTIILQTHIILYYMHQILTMVVQQHIVQVSFNVYRHSKQVRWALWVYTSINHSYNNQRQQSISSLLITKLISPSQHTLGESQRIGYDITLPPFTCIRGSSRDCYIKAVAIQSACMQACRYLEDLQFKVQINSKAIRLQRHSCVLRSTPGRERFETRRRNEAR